MNNKLINGIIVLMSVVLTGLLIIQIIWIKRAVELREQQFSQNVHDALSEAAFMLEREETFNIFQNGLFEDGFVPFKPNSPFNFSWIEEQLKDYEANNNAQTMGGDYVFKLDTTITIDDTDGATMKNKLHITIEDSVEQVQLSQKMENKKALMSNMFREFLNKSRNIEERIDKSKLEELVKKSLQQHGINIPFEFIVKDYFGETIIVSNHPDIQKRGTVYKITLFPNDFFGEPNFLFIYFPNQQKFIFKSLGVITFASVLFVIIIMVCFAYVINTIFKQKKLNDMKTDFINNMTHELKTPVATISLASEMLKKNDIIENKDKSLRYAGIIYDENKRLGDQVEKVLQMAVLDKGDFKLNKTEIDAHEIIRKVIDKLSLQIEGSNGKVNLLLHAPDHKLMADEVHFTNIIFNLVDNAIKYSFDHLEITISTETILGKLHIAISDKGIGMSKDAHKRVFEKFYRVPTGNIHNVKGFGLGLSYVKIMTEAHEGTIEVNSELGKGSIFKIILPIIKPPL
jgi:two-component system phosphate regulon sensor histidine kinase PhoR